MRAEVVINGGIAGELLVVDGEKGRPFIELSVRGREMLLSRDEARMVSDALRALAVSGSEPRFHLPM